MTLGPTTYNPDAALWDTDRLHWLEEAVEYQVPEDVPLSKRRNVPDKEVGQHSERRGEENPGKSRDGRNGKQCK